MSFSKFQVTKMTCMSNNDAASMVETTKQSHPDEPRNSDMVDAWGSLHAPTSHLTAVFSEWDVNPSNPRVQHSIFPRILGNHQDQHARCMSVILCHRFVISFLINAVPINPKWLRFTYSLASVSPSNMAMTKSLGDVQPIFRGDFPISSYKL